MMYNYANHIQNDYPLTEATTNFQMPRQMPNHNVNISNASEGFIRGNMFSNLFQPYIAGEPFRLNPQNEREDSLNKLRATNFAVLDLGLYLDTHPDDAEALEIFNQYRTESIQLETEFERRYGPLTLHSDVLTAYPWTWIMSPWPWEVK